MITKVTAQLVKVSKLFVNGLMKQTHKLKIVGLVRQTHKLLGRVQTSKVSLPNIYTPLYHSFKINVIPNVLTVCR